VLRKAKERLGAIYGKNSQFKVDFHCIVNQMLTKEEFEAAWVHMLSTYALEKNPYLQLRDQGKVGEAVLHRYILCKDDQHPEKRKRKSHAEDLRPTWVGHACLCETIQQIVVR
jgi:hypothetical protein